MFFFKWFEKYPKYFKVTSLGICYGFGAIGGIIGLVCWIASGFKNMDALTIAICGAVVALGVHKLMVLTHGMSERELKDEREDEEKEEAES